MYYRLPLAVILGCFLSREIRAQIITPETVGLAPTSTVGPGGRLTPDGGFTDATGTAGANPGWTLFTYGQESGGGRLLITATSTAWATQTYTTSNPTTPNTSGPALNFNPSAAGNWRIIDPSAGSTATLRVTTSDGADTYLSLNSQSDLASYNARLNSVLKFDSSYWIDPNTNAPIAASVGTFSYSFANFEGGRYRSIDLVYTPQGVPEPSSAVLVGIVGVGYWIRRRYRGRPAAGSPA